MNHLDGSDEESQCRFSLSSMKVKLLKMFPKFTISFYQMASWVKTVLGAVAFAVPVTITCMDYIGLVVKVEGESMQVLILALNFHISWVIRQSFSCPKTIPNI